MIWSAPYPCRARPHKGTEIYLKLLKLPLITEIMLGSVRTVKHLFNLLPYTYFISPICSIYRNISSILISVSTLLDTAMGIIILQPWAHLNFT